MLGFAGFPLTGGMFGKLFVFSAAYDAGEWWLVLVGVAATAISLAYYLNVVRWLYMRSGAEAPARARRWVAALGPGARHGRGGLRRRDRRLVLRRAADPRPRCRRGRLARSSPLPRHHGGSPRRRASAGLDFAPCDGLTWLGHSAFASRPRPASASTSTRSQRQPEDPGGDDREPERCDLILLTHGHGDHRRHGADPPALRLSRRRAGRAARVADRPRRRRRRRGELDQQGRHDRGRGRQGDAHAREPLVERPRRDVRGRIVRVRAGGSRTGSRSTSPATRTSSATCR